MNPTTQLVEAIGRTLGNYASCRDQIGLDSFSASLLVCFGERNPSKTPIDDLYTKGQSAILLAMADAVDAEIGGKAKYEGDFNRGYDLGFDVVAARMRTFTAGLREAAK